MAVATLKKTFNWDWLTDRGSVPYHHGRKHGSVQSDTVLEKEQEGLHLDQQEESGILGVV